MSGTSDTVHRDKVATLIRNNLDLVKQISLSRWEWDLSRGCSAPFRLEKVGRQDGFDRLVGRRPQHAISLLMLCPCGRCDRCLENRRRYWCTRALSERSQATRIWFGTLTIAPEHRHKMLVEARQAAWKAGCVLEDLKGGHRFQYLWRPMGAEIQRYLKRLRKELPLGALRYFIVAEAHKDGTPHAHALFYEQQEGALRKKLLDDQWKVGFSQWRLRSDSGAVFYVAKYLTKSTTVRVRASVGFGKQNIQPKPDTDRNTSTSQLNFPIAGHWPAITGGAQRGAGEAAQAGSAARPPNQAEPGKDCAVPKPSETD